MKPRRDEQGQNTDRQTKDIFIVKRNVVEVINILLVGFKSTPIPKCNNIELKGCVHYIFASFFFASKREHLSNKEKFFLLHS